LKGYRGKEPASITALVEIILKISKFIEQNSQVKELDLNPIFAYRDKAVAVDARIILEKG
jgi:acyl-CoA synthetase (NDP forming)